MPPVSRIAFYGLFCLLLGLSGALQAAEMQTRRRQEGNWLLVDGWLAVGVDIGLAWQVLTDYENFPAFVPGIRSNRILSTQGHRKLVEQQGEMLAGSLRMPYAGQMQIHETPGQGLQIRFISGLFKDVEGEWRIEARKPLKLAYQMRVDMMKSPFPAPLAPQIAEQQVRTWVTAFAQEMEQRHNNKGAAK
jgi:ribosome-associated toxin RatA of RatAB toxin-antitoxin module